MPICPNCGRQLADGSLFCGACGVPINQVPQQQQVNPQWANVANAPLVCAKCGITIPDPNMKFCPQCGQRVGERVRMKAPDDWVASKLNRLVGGTDQIDVRFSDFFTDIPKHHSREDAEVIFACGTTDTTPPLEAIVTTWPKPWIYSRVFAVLLLTFLGCIAMFLGMGSPFGLPGIIFIGSMMVPFATVIFFFETNVPRNISISQAVQMFFVGGVASILAVGIIGILFPDSGVGDLVPAMLTGILEELAKILIIVYYMKRHPGRDYILNGLLIGATVGAGFATFESAGYAFYLFLGGFFDGLVSSGGVETLAFQTGFDVAMQVIVLRGFLAIGGHVAWAAAEGGALALAEGNDGFKFAQVVERRFITIALISIVLHGLWDANVLLLDLIVIPFTGGVTIKYLLLIAAIWIVIGVLLHRGLAQINLLANKARRRARREMGQM